MHLSPQEVERFEREGYLFFPACSRPWKCRCCKTKCRDCSRSNDPKTCAKRIATRCAPISPRTCTASRSPAWRGTRAWSSRSMQIFGEAVYMHQFKINGKMAFDGDVWQWHQDYGTWKADDDMPEPRAMNVAVFLDEVNEFNGPLMFIPRQPQAGRASRPSTTSPRRAIRCGRSTTTRSPSWSTQGGIVAPKGPAGSMILFHCLPGARVDAQSVAVEPDQRVLEPMRGVERTSAASSGRNTSPTAISRRSTACPTIACCAITTCRCHGATARRPRRYDPSWRPEAARTVSLHARLCAARRAGQAACASA